MSEHTIKNKPVVSLEEALEMKKNGKCNIVAPMPGKQTDFLYSKADRIIYGGAVSGGKSHGLKLAPIYHLLTNKEYNAVIARRTLPQLKQPGGLIEKSQGLYTPLGAKYNKSDYFWIFPLGNKLQFINVNDLAAVEAKDGAQFTLLGIDEAQHWKETHVEALWTRARGLSGVRTQLLMTCNPKKNSWMRKWINWYLDKDGYPIPERSGIVRWFMRGEKGELVWFESKMEALLWWKETFKETYEKAKLDSNLLVMPESFTFIFSKATDNTIMMEGDPDYHSKLANQPKAIRKAKLDGCWDFDENDGQFFKSEWLGDPLRWIRLGREYFTIDSKGRKTLQATIVRCARGYDFAYTAKTDSNDPDWTTSTRIDILDNGQILVADHKFMRDGAGEIQNFMERNAAEDPEGTEISIPQDPAGGVGFSHTLIRDMPGLNIVATREIGSPQGSDLSGKEYRFLPFSNQCRARGIVKMLFDGAKEGDQPGDDEWNARWTAYLSELGNEESKKKKDDCDSTSRAYNHLFDTEEEEEYDPFADI